MLRDNEDVFSGFGLPSLDGIAENNLNVTDNPFGVSDELLFPKPPAQQKPAQLNHSFQALTASQMQMPMPKLPALQNVAIPVPQIMMQQPAQLMPKSKEMKETEVLAGFSSSSSSSSSSAFVPEISHTEKENVEIVRIIAIGKNSAIQSAVAKYYSDKIPVNLKECLENLSDESNKTELLLFFAKKLKHSWVVSCIPQITNILSSIKQPYYNMDHLVEDSFGAEEVPQELQQLIIKFQKCRRGKTALPDRGILARLFIAHQADNPNRPKAKSEDKKEDSLLSDSRKRTNAEAGLPQATYGKDEKAADSADDEVGFAPLPKRARDGSNRVILQKLLDGQKDILARLSGEDTEKLKARNRELEEKAASQAATIRSLTAENNILRGKVEVQDAVLAYLEAAGRQLGASAAPAAAMASSVAQGLPALPSAMGHFASTQPGGSLQNLPSQQGLAQPQSFAQDPVVRFKS